MAAEIGIKIGVDGASQASSQLAGVNKSLGDLGKASDLAKNALAAIGVGVSVAGFTSWIKSAIDAADAMNDISERTGLATREIAGLQLAFQLGDVSADALTGTMSKLSRSVVDNADAFKAIGVETKAADGAFRSTRQILGDVADRFASYEDGVEKAALAQQLFGKSGADLIPVLNMGAKGLAEMDEMAERLGLTIEESTAQQAGRFNDVLDLIGAGAKGVATRIAAELLPTLSGLADEFFTSATSGDTLKRVAEGLGMALKALYVTGRAVVEAFSAVGKTLGAAGAVIASVLKGDFQSAASIAKELKADLQAGFTDALGDIERAWNTTGSAAVESLSATQRAAKATAPVIREAGKAAKEAGDEFATQRTAAAEYAKAWSDFNKIAADASASTDGLGKAQARLVEYLSSPAYQQHTDSMREIVLQEGYAAIAAEQNADAQKAAAKAIDDRIKAAQGAADSAEQALADLQLENDAAALAARSNVSLAQAIQTVTIARLEEARAALVTDPARAAELAAIDREIAARRRLRDAIGSKDAREAAAKTAEEQTKAVKKAADDAEQEWKKTSEQIERSLTDALMRGFEDGKGFAQNLKDTVVNMFKTMILRPAIQAVVSPMARSVTSAFGFPMGGSGSSAGSAAGFLGLGSFNATYEAMYAQFATSQVGSTLGLSAPLTEAIGGIEATANSITAFGEAVGSALPYLGAVISLAQGDYVGATTTAIGAAIAGPVGAIIGSVVGSLINSQLGGETRTGSSYGYSREGGDVNILNGMINVPLDRVSGNLSGPSGGPIGGAQGDIAAQQAITATITGVNALFDKLGAEARIDQFWSKLESSDNARGGVLSGGRLTTGAAFGESGFGSNYAGDLFEQGTPFTLTGEEAFKAFGLDLQQSVIQALQAARDQLPVIVQDFIAGIDAEQLTEEQVSGVLAGIDAISRLLDVAAELSVPVESVTTAMVNAAGGVEALTAGFGTYFANFYTEEQRAGMAMGKLSEALASIGVDVVPRTREEFAALVDGIDKTTEAGQAQYGALISLSGAFAALVPQTQILAAGSQDLAELYRSVGLLAEASAIEARLLADAFGEVGLTIPTTREELQALVLAASPEQAFVIRQFAGALLELPSAAAEAEEAVEVVAEAVNELLGRISTSAAEALALTQEWPTRDDWIEYYARAGFEGAAALLAEEYAADWRLAWQSLNLDLPIPTTFEEFDAVVETLREAALAGTVSGNTLVRVLSLADEFARQLPQTIEEIVAPEPEMPDGRTPVDQPAGDDGSAQRIADERYRLETQLLQVQGDTVALRARELAQLDPSNRAIQQRIWALEDEKTAAEVAAQAEREAAEVARQAAEDAQRAAKEVADAWRAISDSLLDEVRRIRGEIVDGSGRAFAALQAEFAIATAAARAGDREAAESLTGLARQVIDAGAAQAATLLDAQRLRAAIADSLQATSEIVNPDAPRVLEPIAPPPPDADFGGMERVGRRIDALRDDQRAQASASTELLLRVARLVEQWDGEGLPTARTEA